ncbi:Bacterial membrane flanked domain protein [Posidoniimonas polymericola]|uniref:Bacterial membrane flanked domain protein n=1 Tax=Posidoniimonas polymericola TaxID=2528002 RepID=A0A5C5YU79_9BACT|nr:PH domain-containing protein [Posidoniimonas polymericola]TWT78505.1 Bacterial membrane flanked domain protein [Posidoniimonas polymericola]
MQCPACQTETETDAAFCHKCGADLRAENGERAATDPDPTADEHASAPAAKPSPHEEFRKATHLNSADDEEDIEDEIWDGAYSSKAMVGQWIAAAAATVLAVVIGVMTGTWLIVIGLAVLVWVIMIAWFAYRRYSVHYTLTTQRLIHESGILWRTIDRIELIDIDDVTFKQGPVERAFRVGSIIVISGDKTSPELNLPGIDNVRGVADKIDDARRKERRRRGLHMITQGA